jgi:hypothetical protein
MMFKRTEPESSKMSKSGEVGYSECNEYPRYGCLDRSNCKTAEG